MSKKEFKKVLVSKHREFVAWSKESGWMRNYKLTILKRNGVNVEITSTDKESVQKEKYKKKRKFTAN